jgi:hypothetical protein
MYVARLVDGPFGLPAIALLLPVFTVSPGLTPAEMSYKVLIGAQQSLVGSRVIIHDVAFDSFGCASD